MLFQKNVTSLAIKISLLLILVCNINLNPVQALSLPTFVNPLSWYFSGYKQNQSTTDPGNVSTYLHVLQSFFPNSNHDNNEDNDEDNNNNNLRRNSFEEVDEENFSFTSKNKDKERIEDPKSISIETTEISNPFLNTNMDLSTLGMDLNSETEPQSMQTTAMPITNTEIFFENKFLAHSEEEEPLMDNVTSLMIDNDLPIENSTAETTTTTIMNNEMLNLNNQMDKLNKIESESMEREFNQPLNSITTTTNDNFQTNDNYLSTESPVTGSNWLKNNLMPTTIKINADNELNIGRNMFDDDFTTNVAELSSDTTLPSELNTSTDIKMDNSWPEMSTTTTAFITTISPETLIPVKEINNDGIDIKNDLNEHETNLLLPPDIQARIMTMNGIDDDENNFKRKFHNAYYSNSAIFDDLMKRYSMEFRQQKAMKLFNQFNNQLSITDNELNEINHLFFGGQLPVNTVQTIINSSMENLSKK